MLLPTFRALSLFALLGLALSACGSSRPALDPSALDLTATEDPVAAFQEIERRLLTREAYGFPIKITATGALATNLAGRFSVDAERFEVLEARGQWSEQPVDLALHSESDTLYLQGARGRKGLPRPYATREALILGLTRMGLLHNLFLLRANAAPDGSDGDISKIATPVNHRFAAAEADGMEGVRALAFDLEVQGQPVGQATLWFDAESGMPVRRRQVVRFPGGDMKVFEDYSR